MGIVRGASQSISRTGDKSGLGFTLVELLVTLAVAAVLLGFAAPTFENFVVQRSMTAEINDLVLAINYARSEAARRGRIVSVQANDAVDDDEWGGGYCVVVGTPGNCDDPVLRHFAPVGDRTLDGFNSPDGAMNGVEVLSFDGRGMLAAGEGGAVRLCDQGGANPGRLLRVNLIGRTTTNEVQCEA